MNKKYKIQMILKESREVIDNFYRKRVYDTIEDAKIDVAYYYNCDKRAEKFLREKYPETYDTEFGDLIVEYSIIHIDDNDIDPFFLTDIKSLKFKRFIKKIFNNI